MPGKAQLIGIYALPVDEELITAQAKELCGDEPTPAQLAQIREQLNSTVLAEVLVTDADANFKVGDFAQAKPDQPRDNWEVAWAEAFLSPDGEQLLVKRWERLPPGAATFRIAFYIHHWQMGEPLLSSYGSLSTPPPAPMPTRLNRLVPYELTD